MFRFFLQHGDCETSRLIYMAGGSVEIKAGAPSKKEEKAVPGLEYDPSKKTHDEIWQTIDATYGKSAYESIISAHVSKLMPTAPGDYKSALKLSSVRRYMRFYEKTKIGFMKKAKILKDEFEDTVENIQEKIGDDLDNLKSALEASKAHFEFKQVMPAISETGDIEDHFEDYLEALNGRYLNADLDQGPDYSSLSSNFEDKMEDWVENKLAWLLQKKGTTKKDLENFKTEIADRYAYYAKIDGNSAILSSKDLTALKAASKPPLDSVSRILDETDDKVMKRLEVMHLMNPDAWETSMEIAGKAIIQAAVNAGMEKEFTKEMNKYKKVANFDEAKNEFWEMLEDVSKAGVPETLEFIRKFNLGVHNEVLKFEQKVEPPALAMQVNKQLDYLLGGVLVPHKDTDRMVVRFMQAGREGRNDILANPGTRDILFRGIRQATEQYPELFDKMLGNMPDDIAKLERSERIEKTAHHDRAAQLQALIILANQAKVIVSKLSAAPEHRGKGYMKAIDQAKIPENSKVVKTGLRFKSANKKPGTYYSALHRGGFNTRDLALKGAKMLGVLTVVANVAQSWSETKGSGDFVDRVFDTVEKSVTNQGFLTGAAITVGSHMAERDKRYLKYWKLSQHEKEGLNVSSKLDNMGRRLGHKEVKRFTNNNAEWRALSDPAMDASTIKKLVDKADERVRNRNQQQSGKRRKYKERAVITAHDLREVIKDESIITTLTSGGRSDRMRYLFYSKFFNNAQDKRDVNQLKEFCTGSSYIASNPPAS